MSEAVTGQPAAPTTGGEAASAPTSEAQAPVTTTETSAAPEGHEGVLNSIEATPQVDGAPETASAEASEAPEASGDEASDAGDEAAPEAPQTFTVKVDGQDVEVSVDDLVQNYSLKAAAYKRFEEAAAMRKDAATVLEALKNPTQVPELLASMGIDFHKVAEDYLYNYIQEQNLPPEEKMRRQLEKERSEFEAQREQYEAQQREQQLAAESERIRAEFEQNFTNALQGVGVPVTPQTIARLAAAHEALIQAGQMPTPAMTGALAQQLKAEYDNELQSLVGALGPAELAKYLGDDGVKKVREHNIAQVTQAAPAKEEVSKTEPLQVPETKPLDLDELRAKLKSRF